MLSHWVQQYRFLQILYIQEGEQYFSFSGSQVYWVQDSDLIKITIIEGTIHVENV